eukprot:3620548-Rhodomonas_salina.2
MEGRYTAELRDQLLGSFYHINPRLQLLSSEREEEEKGAYVCDARLSSSTRPRRQMGHTMRAGQSSRSSHARACGGWFCSMLLFELFCTICMPSYIDITSWSHVCACATRSGPVAGERASDFKPVSGAPEGVRFGSGRHAASLGELNARRGHLCGAACFPVSQGARCRIRSGYARARTPLGAVFLRGRWKRWTLLSASSLELESTWSDVDRKRPNLNSHCMPTELWTGGTSAQESRLARH